MTPRMPYQPDSIRLRRAPSRKSARLQGALEFERGAGLAGTVDQPTKSRYAPEPIYSTAGIAVSPTDTLILNQYRSCLPLSLYDR